MHPLFKNANVTLMVRDFEKSLQFYTETLGLRLQNRWKNEFAEVEGPGLTIGLHPIPKDINFVRKLMSFVYTKGVNLSKNLRPLVYDEE